MENRSTTFEADRPLEPGVKLRIVERDAVGAMVGFWEGHYSDERGAVKLYPRANPYCLWQVPRVVHTIDSRLVRVKRSTLAPVAPKKAAPKEESVPRGFWKMPLVGQERMDI